MADNTPLQTVGGSYHREITLIRHIEVKFILGGPTNDGDPEPYDILDTFVPQSTPLNLPETDRHATKNDKGEWELTITYEGIPATDPIPDPGDVLKTGRGAEIELDHVGVEDRLEMSPKYAAIKDKYGGLDDGKGNLTGWQNPWTDPSTGESTQNPLLGFTHFLNDGVVLRLTFATPTFSADYLKNICKIDPSLIPTPIASAIPTSATYGWLKRAVKGQFRGNVWKLIFEWELGIWLNDQYSPDP
jgi:hypothetical protein